MTEDEWWDEFEAERLDDPDEVDEHPDEMIWTQIESDGLIQYMPGCRSVGDGYYLASKPWGPEHSDLVITVDDDDLRAMGYR